MDARFQHWIDSPTPGQPVPSSTADICGWILPNAEQRITDPRLVSRSGRHVFHLTVVDRPDVRAKFGSGSARGFQQRLPVEALPPFEAWDIEFLLEGTTARFPIGLTGPTSMHESFLQRKRRKLEAVRGILCCPLCHRDGLFQHGDVPHCSGCDRTYGTSESSFNFLTDELRRDGGVKPTTNVSGFGYDADMLDIVDRHRSGLVLDAGAGFKPVYYDNVVNLEIVDYPTTDVL